VKQSAEDSKIFAYFVERERERERERDESRTQLSEF
jgi:hypothetical protein